MENEIESASGGTRSPNELGARGAARRRLAKAGLGAGGVLMTLSSKSALAAGCVTPSGFVSATLNASQNPRYSCSSNGSHGYWKNHQDAWSATGVRPEDPFGAHFQTGAGYGHLKDVPLIGILDPQSYFAQTGEDSGQKKGKGGGEGQGVPPDFDPNNVAMQTVAAYLNARLAQATGDTRTVLTPEQVKTIWADYVFKGSYLPQPNATPWGGAQIAYYFESTFQRD